jgi:hypothetical protein
VSAKDESLARQSHRVLPWYLRACVGFVRERDTREIREDEDGAASAAPTRASTHSPLQINFPLSLFHGLGY